MPFILFINRLFIFYTEDNGGWLLFVPSDRRLLPSKHVSKTFSRNVFGHLYFPLGIDGIFLPGCLRVRYKGIDGGFWFWAVIWNVRPSENRQSGFQTAFPRLKRLKKQWRRVCKWARIGFQILI